MSGFNVNCKDCINCIVFKSRIQTSYICTIKSEHIKDIDQNIDCFWFVKCRKNRV